MTSLDLSKPALRNRSSAIATWIDHKRLTHQLHHRWVRRSAAVLSHAILITPITP
jgi:hypothetical protein